MLGEEGLLGSGVVERTRKHSEARLSCTGGACCTLSFPCKSLCPCIPAPAIYHHGRLWHFLLFQTSNILTILKQMLHLRKEGVAFKLSGTEKFTDPEKEKISLLIPQAAIN